MTLTVISLVLRLLDGIVLIASSSAVFGLYLSGISELEEDLYIAAIGMALLFQQYVFHVSGVYKSENLVSFYTQIKNIFLSWSGMFLFFIVTAFLFKLSGFYSRVWVVGWFVVGIILFVLSRIVLAALLKIWTTSGKLNANIAVLGEEEIVHALLNRLSSQQEKVNVVGVFGDRGRLCSHKETDIPWLGESVNDLIEYARFHKIDLILVAFPLKEDARILKIVQQLSVLPVDVRLWTEMERGRLLYGGYSEVFGVPVINLLDRPMNDWQIIIKRSEDLILSSLFLVTFAPLMALVALGIRLESRGPVFFQQKRFGFSNHIINIYKFRTMYSEEADPTAKKLTIQNDPRVTPFGRILRKSSIDELPQLFNVLKGEMSIVGPRPHAVGAAVVDRPYFEVVDEYFVRHRIKPGITGWAQVNGWRGNTDTEEKLEKRIECDLYYIDNWSIWLDIKILIMTIYIVVVGKNAY